MFNQISVTLVLILALAPALLSQSRSTQDIQKVRDVESIIVQTEQVLADYPSSDFTPNFSQRLRLNAGVAFTQFPSSLSREYPW